jgi:hypothetical protein
MCRNGRLAVRPATWHLVAVVVLIAGWTIDYALRAAQEGAEPVIRASFRELQ